MIVIVFYDPNKIRSLGNDEILLADDQKAPGTAY